MATKKDENRDEARIYRCGFCGAEYTTRQGLAKHLRVCDYRPDEDDDGLPDVSGGGVDLFGDEDTIAAGASGHDTGASDAMVYQCPDCGYLAEYQYSRCPACGSWLEW